MQIRVQKQNREQGGGGGGNPLDPVLLLLLAFVDDRRPPLLLHLLLLAPHFLQALTELHQRHLVQHAEPGGGAGVELRLVHLRAVGGQGPQLRDDLLLALPGGRGT